MAKTHPDLLPSSPLYSRSEERETYTVWMKFLIFNSHGCTIFDSCGNTVYRIDNYDTKCGNQVFSIDLKGEVLTTFLKKIII